MNPARFVVDLAELRASDSERFDAALDALALTAPTSPKSMDALLTAVHQLELARPAIASVLPDPARIDDAEQATLLAVERGLKSFEGRSAFRTWLYRVARNEALGTIRRSDPGSSTVEFGSADLGEYRVSSVVLSRQRIEQAISALPLVYREAFVLRAIDGATYEEIAQTLDVPLNTVRSRLHAARQQLQQALTADE